MRIRTMIQMNKIGMGNDDTNEQDWAFVETNQEEEVLGDDEEMKEDEDFDDDVEMKEQMKMTFIK